MQAKDTAGTHVHDSRNSGFKNCLGLTTRQDFPPKCCPSEVTSGGASLLEPSALWVLGAT